jgi:pimeloyl-ACP methyl ester carboxylesterase
MTSGLAHPGDIDIAYETFGLPTGDPLLLVMGVGAQMRYWHDEFCVALAERGFHVARLDNRDSGLSTHLTTARRAEPVGDADPARLGGGLPAGGHDRRRGGRARRPGGGRRTRGRPVDGRDDRPDHGHPVPSRVRSLTSISSTPSWRIGRKRLRTTLRIVLANPALLVGRQGAGPEQVAQRLIAAHRVIGSPDYPVDEAWLRDLAQRMHVRGGLDRDGARRQNAAILASGDRRSALAAVRAPTPVLHGEPTRWSGRGRRGHRRGHTRRDPAHLSRMGHDLPRELGPQIINDVRALADHTTSA